MQIVREKPGRSLKEKLTVSLALVVIGVAVNLIGASITGLLGAPLYLDSIGTIFASIVGGYLPGIIIGLISPAITSITTDPSALSYGMLHVFIAVFSAWASERGWFKKPSNIALAVLVYAVIGGVLGTFLTMFLYGFGMEDTSAGLVGIIYGMGFLGKMGSELLGDFIIDLGDKIISVAVVLLILRLVPEEIQKQFHIHMWQQAPLTNEARMEFRKSHSRKASLKSKITMALTLSALLIAVSAITISYVLYRDVTIETQKELGTGVAKLAAAAVNGDDVDRYLAEGKAAGGYAIVENRLNTIRNSANGIEYIYVYQIKEDGCHVVFDLDTEELEGASPGEVIAFDESFAPYIPSLLAGEPIEPMITDDTYGWLLTVYEPIRDHEGNTVAYAATDISMESLRESMHAFLTQQISLFMGIFILILAAGLYMIEYGMILPVNTMSLAANGEERDSETSLRHLVETFKKLDVHTGDEIENLYLSFCEMTADNLRAVEDIKEKNRTISRMQSALIVVLADMVESRDENTGDHVKKTAEYTRIIMNEMKKEGIYEDALTEKFMDDVYHSAPLHDIGKIGVSDAVLNKPGKLTDEEFAKMKLHTTIGAQIIDQVIDTMPDSDGGSDYLKEAKNLALYHHEKWNGAGYPTGISGEDIPLSARIMAVADVFDALVSKRSYKEGFPFEKAMDIIRESSGSHFDPRVAQAFLNAGDEVRKVSEMYDRRNEKDGKSS